MANDTVLIIGSGTNSTLCYVAIANVLPSAIATMPHLYVAASNESIQVPQVWP